MGDARSSRGSDAGLEREAVRNEVLKFMPRAFVDLYELLVWSALGPGLGVNLEGSKGKAAEGALTRLRIDGSGKGPTAEWQCICGYWTPSADSFCVECDRPWNPRVVTRLRPDVEVKEGGVIDVGKAQRARLSTSEGSIEGRVTRGPAKGSAHGKREGARRKPVVGEEYAIALRARVDRALVRVVREVSRDAAHSSRGSEALRDGASEIADSSQVSTWRRCSRTGPGGVSAETHGGGKWCGRLLEGHWLFCPYCGATAMDEEA